MVPKPNRNKKYTGRNQKDNNLSMVDEETNAEHCNYSKIVDDREIKVKRQIL